jgi:23S rRNA (adenine-N6)-dimethyltransferase
MSVPLHPSIFYSQNYLKDSRLVSTLLEKSGIGRDDVVYEIGPGKGIITGQLVRYCKHVVAVEKDPCLVAMLMQKFAHEPSVTIREGDFLQYRLPYRPYKVFANIPFNITSAIVTKLTSANNPPEEAYLTMQEEAASIYLGKPMESLRAVLLKPWFEVEIVHRFRRRDFVPEPRVEVVMLRLHKRGPPLVSRKNRQLFRDFVVYGFTTWKPSMGQILKGVFTRHQFQRIKKVLEINPDMTPTTLSFEQWLKLFECFLEEGTRQAMCTITGSEKQFKRWQKRVHKIHRTRI